MQNSFHFDEFYFLKNHEKFAKNIVKIKTASKCLDINLVSLDGNTKLLLANCYLPSRGSKKICNERYERVTKDLISTIHKVKNEHKNKRIYTLAFGDLNFCIFKHNGDKKRLRLIKTLIKELDGTYHIPDLPTHKSRAHVGSESHLDGAILEDGLNLEMMQVLDEEDFAA